MFSSRRLLVITRKEIKHITRDFRSFFLVVISPAVMLFILAYLFALDVNEVNLAWLDWDQSQVSRTYLQKITNDGSFRLRLVANNYAELEQSLLTGDVDIGIVVPYGFASDYLSGKPASLQALVDGSDAVAARTALSYLEARTIYAFMPADTQQLPDIRTRIWYNPELRSNWSMIPGLAAIVLSLPTMAFSLAIKKEEEMGTFEALIPTPVTGLEYQFGKLFAYLLTGMLSALLVAAVSVLWFHVPLRGSLWIYCICVAEFYLACMGIALLITRFVDSQQTAMFLVLLIFFVPGFFVSGLILPVNTSSTAAKITAYVLPGTHLMSMLRGIFLKGSKLVDLLPQIRMLGLITVIGLFSGLALFRKQVR